MIDLKKLQDKFDTLFEEETEESFNQWLKNNKKRKFMTPNIENLKVWMSGRSTTGYQRALAMREFEKLLDYVTELEQLRQPTVIKSGCGLCCKPVKDFDEDLNNFCDQCWLIINQQTYNQNK